MLDARPTSVAAGALEQKWLRVLGLSSSCKGSLTSVGTRAMSEEEWARGVSTELGGRPVRLENVVLFNHVFRTTAHATKPKNLCD